MEEGDAIRWVELGKAGALHARMSSDKSVTGLLMWLVEAFAGSIEDPQTHTRAAGEAVDSGWLRR